MLLRAEHRHGESSFSYAAACTRLRQEKFTDQLFALGEVSNAMS